ncbi:ribosomal-protein-S5-alanine N-acetyltransferase [compost metagenome]
MAHYMPENERSGALLKRLGFEVEGLARDYLKINGAWRDHVLTARINDADDRAGSPEG